MLHSGIFPAKVVPSPPIDWIRQRNDPPLPLPPKGHAVSHVSRPEPLAPPAVPPVSTVPTEDTTDVMDARRALALGVVLAAQFMAIFDQFVVNVALATIQRDLGATLADIQFVVAGYALAYAVLLVTGGRLGDLFGRKRLFLAGVAGFTVASALCGAATSPGALVAFRLLQGLAAAIMTPQVLAILQTTFTGRARDTAYGAFGAVNGLGGIVGQSVGGLLVRADLFGLGWRTAFLVNIPVGIAAVILAWRLLPESRSTTARGLDLGGVAIGSAGLLLLVFPLVAGAEAGWPPWAWACLALALPVLALFVWFEGRVRARGGAPLMDPALFRVPTFRIGNLARFMIFAANGGYFLILALTLQIGLHFSPFEAGATFFPDAIGFFIAATLTPRLVRRFDVRLLNIGTGMKCIGLMGVIATVWLAGDALSGWHLAPTLFVQGFGTGLTAAPLISFILAGVRNDEVGAASGVLNTMQQVATAFGVALTGVLFAALLGGANSVATYTHAFAAALAVLVGALWVAFAVLFALPRSRPAA